VRNTRWWWIGGGVVLVLLVAWMKVRGPRAIDVDVTTVSSGALRITVDEAATTRVRHHVDVAAPASGRYVPAGVRVGDSVQAGTAIGSLYPAPLDRGAEEQARQHASALEASQRGAETRVQVAEAAQGDATRTWNRIKRLHDAGGVSDRELEQARIAMDAASSDLVAAKERVREIEFERSSVLAVLLGSRGGANDAIRVVAGERGRVLRIYEEHERVVLAGTPLVQVGDTRELEVVIPVLTSDAARVRRNAVVRYTVGGGRDTLVGYVRLVEPSAFTRMSALGVEEQRVNVIAAVTDSAGRLGDQYRLDARITVWESARVTTVPTGALVRDGKAWSVYVVDGGRARRHRIDVGERGTDAVEVRSGLNGGDRVILYPSEQVTDGIRVRER
jgi:HlyD family secretion protein